MLRPKIVNDPFAKRNFQSLHFKQVIGLFMFIISVESKPPIQTNLKPAQPVKKHASKKTRRESKPP